MEKLPITAIICTLNSENSVRECLSGLTLSGIEQIVVVDGGSTDSTLSIVSEFECLVLHDEGKGLGAARNLGITVATQPFILNCGSDNVLHSDLVIKMLTRLQMNESTIAVSCRTRVPGENYISRALNLQWQGRIQPGIENVMGTPNLIRTNLLLEFKFSNERSFSDDEDLCTRIRKKYHGDFIVIPEYCLEIGQAEIGTLRKRFDYYGKSDYEIYSAYSGEWGTARRIQSYLHPLKSEFIDIAINLPLRKFFIVAPFLIWSTVVRYRGWIKSHHRSVGRCKT
jgi:glycosyltransferase involved in cell wall biosynthesis